MKYWHSGITVWCGVPDTPGPDKKALPGVAIPITIAVRPANPANVVTVQYRVNAEAPRAARARPIETDGAANVQYFEALLPPAAVGSAISFVPVCECNGRQAPDRKTMARMPLSLAIAADAAPPARRQPVAFAAPPARPADLATARKQRATLETQLQSLRSQSARTAQQLADRRRRYPAADPAIAALTTQVRTQGRSIEQALRSLRAMSDHVKALKVVPPDVNAPLAGVSDLYPVLLLPVRIETRFDATTTPKLLVRIFPDQLAVDGHHDGLSDAELADGNAWLSESTGPTEEKQRTAWRKLATKYGSRRAAWIASRMRGSTPPASLGESPVFPPPRAFLLPDCFVVTLYRADGAIAYQKATRPVDDQLAMLWDRQEASEGDGELFDAGTRWMSDFDTASSAGMALAIGISQADFGAGFSRLTVVGVRASRPPQKTATEAVASHQAMVEEFVRHHHYSDGFAFLAPGAPTNNTASAQSAHSESARDADLDFDVEIKAPELLRDGRTDGERLAAALGIDAATFDFICGERESAWSYAKEMQRALWPATGEYVLRYMLPDLMPAGTPERLENHFAEFVRARGPLPAVRIGKQPYGVLPVSKLQAWTAKLVPPEAPVGLPAGVQVVSTTVANPTLAAWIAAQNAASLQFQTALHAVLMRLMQNWTRIAARENLVPRIGGNEADLDAQLLAVLGMSPGSTEVRTRAVVDERLVATMLPTFLSDVIAGLTPAQAAAAAKEALAAWVTSWGDMKENTALMLGALAKAAGLTSANFVSAPLLEGFGWVDSFPLKLPLVQAGATAPSAYLRPLAAGGTVSLSGGNDTLLAELLVHAGKRARDPAAVRTAIGGLKLKDKDLPTDVLAGLLTDVLDLCSYRLDAWITSLAYARLLSMRASKPKGIHVGAYGWVEDVRRSDGDESGGYIHAPSVAHAAAGAVLRNAFLTHQVPGQDNPFAVNLTSERVRRALELIDGVRTGQPLSVMLGYQFERGLHDGQRDDKIALFRAAFPLVANKETTPLPTDPVEAVAARNVVDGVALATGWRAARGPAATPAASFTLPSVDGAAGVVVSDANVIGELEALIDSLDAVGDVLLTEGVFQTVQGNYERAGAALDALAGVAAPDQLDAMSTPLPGVSFENRVCVVFGETEAPDAALAGGPRALAEPRLAAWLSEMVGDPAKIECRASYVRPAGGSATLPSITLAALGLDAVDLMYLSTFPASGELTELERRIGYYVQSKAAIKADSRIEIDVARPRAGARGLGEAMELARRALELIGGAQPLAPDALVLPPEQLQASPGFDADSYSKLLERVQAAQDKLDALAAQVEGGLSATAEGSRIDVAYAADKPTLAALLLELGRFGIERAVPDTPVLSAQARTRAVAAAAEAKARLAKCAAAKQAAADALTAAAPAPDDPDNPPPAPSQPQRCAKAVALLQESMKALFGDRFVALPAFAVGVADQLQLRQALSQVHVDGDAPTARERVMLWLQQAAQTHRGVARLEDLLLTSAAWRTIAVAADAPVTGAVDELPESARTLCVAQLPYDPEIRWLALSDDERGSSDRPRGRVGIVSLQRDVNLAARVAGLMIERWQETIPAEDVTTGVAFHFDRPNSLAPQSMLLAVPHTWGAVAGEWKLADLVDIVRDTAELTRIRLVDADALGELDRLFPALFLPQDPDRPTFDREVALPGIRKVLDQMSTP